MDGLGMLAEISLIYRIHNIKTEIIAASMYPGLCCGCSQ